MGRGSSQEKAGEWTRRLQRFEKTDQTVAAFCEGEGVQPTHRSRLRRLTGHALVEHFFAGTVPRGEFDSWIMCKSIEIILPCVSHRHGIDSFSQEFDRLITHKILPSRINELIGE